jgi:hypothetical protein
MKRIVSGLIGIIFMALGAFNGYCEENLDGLSLWGGVGYQNSTLAFRESSYQHRSILEYDLDGMFYTAGGKYQFVRSSVPRLSVSANTQIARNLEGDSSDSDFQTLVSGDLWIYSVSNIDADQDKYDVNVGWECVNANSDKVKVNALFGYYYNDLKLKDYDVTTRIWDYARVNDVLAGRAATYDASFRGYYFGVDGIWKLNDKFVMHGAWKGMPNLKEKSTGKWLLRDLMFKQDCRGKGYELSLGLTWIPKQNWALDVSATREDLQTDGDSDRFVLSTGKDLEMVNDVDYVETSAWTGEVKAKYIF